MVPGTGIWHTHDVAYIRLPDPLRPSLLNARALFRKTLTRSSRRRMEISQNTIKTAPGEVSAGQTGSKMVSSRCAKGMGGWVGEEVPVAVVGGWLVSVPPGFCVVGVAFTCNVLSTMLVSSC